VAEAPVFLRGDGFDAHAEYRAFLDAVEEPATHLLAEFVHIQNYNAGVPPADVAATQVRDLFCRILTGWATFYIARRVPRRGLPGPGRLRIGIVLVGKFRRRLPFAAPSIGTLESEAERRLRATGY
jgi:hypothetical protein